MKITLKRSWLPWGKPNVEVDYTKEKKFVHIEGAYKKRIITDYKPDIPDEMYDMINVSYHIPKILNTEIFLEGGKEK